MRRLWSTVLGVGTGALLGVAVSGQVVVSRLTESWTVAPGGVYEGTIEIRNTGSAEVVVEVYVTDYLYYADGRILYPPPGENPRSNAGWLTLGLTSPTLAIPPQTRLNLPYTIRVPRDPRLAGTYWCKVNVKFAAGGQEISAGEGLSVGITHVFVYAITVNTHIGNTGTRELRILAKDVALQDGELVFVVDLENPGERAISPVVWVELYNAAGGFVGKFESETGRHGIYPGCSVRHRIKLPSLSPGRYTGLLIMDNLDEYVWGTNVTLDVK